MLTFIIPDITICKSSNRIELSLVGSKGKFLEVVFWMLSAVPHHYFSFETK